MSNTHEKKLTCLICKSTNLVKYLDLGKSALANSFLEKSELTKKERVFPLRVYYCKNCHLAQLVDIVDRKVLFDTYNYLSSASEPLEKYFKEYADTIRKKFPKQTKGFIVEIGSNDGILLKYFKKSGTKILGVDPAKNIARIAVKNGVETLPLFFNTAVAKKIHTKFNKADIIIANHVIAHTDNIHSIVSGVQKLLADIGLFVFEVQYLGDLLQKNQFDNTYHEHVSYFSLAPLVTLLGMYNLHIFNVEHVNAQGGSIRVYAGHAPLIFETDNSVKNILAAEKKAGLHTLKTYKTFGKKPQKLKKDLVSLLKDLKKKNKTVVGYGASAKGNTLLQYSGIGPDLVKYIVDTTPSKQGKLTPGTHIPVYPIEHLKKDLPDYILILTWNYADLIIKKESWLTKKGVKFIKPVTEIEII